MSSKDQWGTQPQSGNYQPVYEPGPPSQYNQYGQYGGRSSYEGGGSGGDYNGDQKSPYENDRFQPKKRINDPFFLVFFILQVSMMKSSYSGILKFV